MMYDKPVLISQGAEAKIYLKENKIYKYRPTKSYRIPEIDTIIIKSRTRSESKIIKKLTTSNVNAPKLYPFTAALPYSTEGNTIVMEYIEGITLHKYILNKVNLAEIFTKLGILIDTVHKLEIIHGDITTKNIIVREDKLFIIDFGLSYTSRKDEDKAVDLYVFEKSLFCSDESQYLKDFYKGYNNNSVLKKLESVRLRGRKREESAIG